MKGRNEGSGTWFRSLKREFRPWSQTGVRFRGKGLLVGESDVVNGPFYEGPVSSSGTLFRDGDPELRTGGLNGSSVPPKGAPEVGCNSVK